MDLNATAAAAVAGQNFVILHQSTFSDGNIFAQKLYHVFKATLIDSYFAKTQLFEGPKNSKTFLLTETQTYPRLSHECSVCR